MKQLIRVFEAFAGYGSQAMAFKRLQQDYPDVVEFEFVGISEIEPNAIKAYNAIHGDVPNFGDITKINWGGQIPDFDMFTYSFPCFVAGTLIHTDKGFIPIEDVMPGDEVLTHTNNYKKVLEVGCRPNAPILKIKGMCFKDIICTPNHPFYVRERYRYGHKRERRFKNPEWIEAKDLNKNHFLGYAINQNSSMPKWAGIVATRWKKEENRLSALFEKTSFWYLMGRYVGDGWKRDSKTGNGVIICCSDRNRTSLFKAIEDCGFNAVSVKERTVEKLFICMNELYSFVDRYGYYAHGKYIDEETINLPIPLLEAFVNGYIDSDGCYTQNEYKTITVSERLAYGMQQCISKVYKCPVRLYFCKRKEDTIIEGRKVNQRDTYSLVWHKERRKQDTAFYENGYVWFPINEITHLNESASVYNMEVEEDNSYTANGAIVHNCQDISNAGLQKGFSEGSGSRSSLLWECEKAIRAKKPKYLMMENVKALVTEKFMPDFKKWISILAEMGYESFWKVLNAKDFGVPQNRERVFMISILNHNGTYHFPKTFKLEKRLKDILEPFVDEKYYLKTEQVQKIVEHCDRKVAEGCGFKTNFQDEDGIAGTITGQYGGRETDTRIKESIGEPEVIQLGNLLPDEEGKFHNPHRGRVYSVDGIAPCQHTCGGGNVPMLLEEPKIIQKVGDRGTDNYSVNDISNTIPANPMSDRGQLLIEPKFLRFGFGHGSQGVSSDIAFAVKASAFEHNNFIVENEEPETKCLNYFDENGEKRSLQDRIYDENGISTAITTSFHPNIAVEEKDGVQYKGEFIKEGDGFDAQKSENFGMNVMDGVSPTIRASKHDTSTCVRNGASYRIRNLTEREVFRLMDVSEEDIDKIQSIGIAKTAQYKLAGNSIVVSCMYHLFRKLFVELKNEGQPSLFDDIW